MGETRNGEVLHVIKDGLCVENEMINTLLVFLPCREEAPFSIRRSYSLRVLVSWMRAR